MPSYIDRVPPLNYSHVLFNSKNPKTSSSTGMSQVIWVLYRNIANSRISSSVARKSHHQDIPRFHSYPSISQVLHDCCCAGTNRKVIKRIIIPLHKTILTCFFKVLPHNANIMQPVLFLISTLLVERVGDTAY